jgi:hypothetical protein
LSGACAQVLSPARLGFESGRRSTLFDCSGPLHQAIPVLTENAQADLAVTGRDVEIERRSVMMGPGLTSSLRMWILPRDASASSSTRRHKIGFVTMDDVQQLEYVTAAFREWDNAGSGGLQRKFGNNISLLPPTSPSWWAG